jgi:hypothetical protein
MPWTNLPGDRIWHQGRLIAMPGCGIAADASRPAARVTGASYTNPYRHQQ